MPSTVSSSIRQRWRRDTISIIELTLGILFASIARLMSRIRPTESRSDLLIVGRSTRSVGDRAMFEAFWQNCPSPLTIVLPAPDSIGSAEATPELTFISLPNLIYSGFRSHIRDLWRLCRLASASKSVSIIGADVMDGRYDVNASIRRFRIIYLASRAGANARVLGFSWNESPPERVVREMLRTDRCATLLSRDTVSTQRLRGHGAKNLKQVADLAFLTPLPVAGGPATAEVEAFISSQRELGRQVLGLNINYLLERYSDQVGILAEVLPPLLSDGVSVVLIPHDSRGKPSDIELLDTLYDSLSDKSHVFGLGETLSPPSVAWLAGQCDYMITGRMHLAILSAVASTPSLAMSYQGKIEGLYNMIGLSYWLDPSQTGVRELNAAIGSIAAGAQAARIQLREQLPALQTAARGNLP